MFVRKKKLDALLDAYQDVLDAQADEIDRLKERLCNPCPTWVNKKGEVMYITDIPTPYLVNIKNFLTRGKPGGILTVVIDELRSREPRD